MENQINIKKVHKKVVELLNKKYDDIKNNYLELYKNYENKDLIRDNYLNEINKKVIDLNKFIQDKEKYIYIYFEYLSLLNYDKKELLNLGSLEITKNNYNYFLEVLPPLFMDKKGFGMSEFLKENLTNYFYENKNKFFVKVIEFKNVGVY